MTDGPLGGPRPLAKDRLSVNMEFEGAPRGLNAGEHDRLIQPLSNKLNSLSGRHPSVNIEHITVYDPIFMPEIQQGFEVEVEFDENIDSKQSGKLTLEQQKEIENFIKDKLENDHHRTLTISI